MRAAMVMQLESKPGPMVACVLWEGEHECERDEKVKRGRTERTYASGVFSILMGALGPPGGLLRVLLSVWRAAGEEAMVGESGV